MPISPLFAIIRDLKTNAIGVREENGAVVWRVFRINLRGGTFDPELSKLPRNGSNCRGVFHTEAEMVKPWCQRVVGFLPSCGPQHESEVIVAQSQPGARVMIYDSAGVEIGDGSGIVIPLKRAIVAGELLTAVQQVGECTGHFVYRVRAGRKNQ